MDERTIRWAVAGPGRMAAAFAKDLALVDGAALVAVGSRDLERAQTFIDAHGAGEPARAHGSYAALCADPEVDVVYIATPHPQHRDIALQAIEAGKAVLVEKAFTSSVAGTQAVIDAARGKGIFCMEGMWTRFNPVVVALHQAIAEGELGELVAVQADLFAHREFDPADRLFDPSLGGGATLDLGVYLLHFAQSLLGEPSSIRTSGARYGNGVDAQASYLLDFANGAQASLACGFRGPGPARLIVVGTKGWAEVGPRFHHPTRLTLHLAGEERVVEPPILGAGYAHEITEVNRCLLEGLTEHPLLSLDQTLSVQRSMASALEELGVHYA